MANALPTPASTSLTADELLLRIIEQRGKCGWIPTGDHNRSGKSNVKEKEYTIAELNRETAAEEARTSALLNILNTAGIYFRPYEQVPLRPTRHQSKYLSPYAERAPGTLVDIHRVVGNKFDVTDDEEQETNYENIWDGDTLVAGASPPPMGRAMPVWFGQPYAPHPKQALGYQNMRYPSY